MLAGCFHCRTGVHRRRGEIVATIVFPLAIGFLLSHKRVSFNEWLPSSIVTDVSLLFLLFVMGARIGGDAEVVGQAAQIGRTALVFALISVTCSVLVVAVLERTLLSGYRQESVHAMSARGDGTDAVRADRCGAGERGVGTRSGAAPYSLTLRLMGAVLCGLVSGYLLVTADHLALLSRVTGWVLGMLLFGVGLELGESGRITGQIRALGWQVLLLPAGIALGSIAGAVCVARFAGLMPSHEAAALASGFGWYSLSAVIIADVHSATLGAMAFLANVLRELVAIMVIPLVASRVGALSSIAPGGATTMDVTLAVVGRAAGSSYVPLAFISGFVLTMLVPFLVRFFLALA